MRRTCQKRPPTGQDALPIKSPDPSMLAVKAHGGCRRSLEELWSLSHVPDTTIGVRKAPITSSRLGREGVQETCFFLQFLFSAARWRAFVLPALRLLSSST